MDMESESAGETPSGAAGNTPQPTSASHSGTASQGNPTPGSPSTNPSTDSTAARAPASATTASSSQVSSKRRRGLGVVTPNACTECRKKRAKVCLFCRSTQLIQRSWKTLLVAIHALLADIPMYSVMATSRADAADLRKMSTVFTKSRFASPKRTCETKSRRSALANDQTSKSYMLCPVQTYGKRSSHGCATARVLKLSQTGWAGRCRRM
jgi:RNA polymerase subunit RPABC4/transcription elongation factor Spt4